MLDACLQPASWPIYRAGNLLFLIFIHVIQQNEFVSHRSLCPGSGLPRHIDRETEYATQPRNIPGQFTDYYTIQEADMRRVYASTAKAIIWLPDEFVPSVGPIIETNAILTFILGGRYGRDI